MLQIHQKKDIFLWLLSSCLLLILLIWVGGLTRLTGSGLSITEWELFSGILPPLNQNKWNEYFDLYKQIPEYKKINYGMSLSEFKFIFWWEYIHRVLARFLVLFYIIPFVYFFLKNKIKKNETYFFLLIFIFFLLQGFMGWYMVKSGLVSDTDVSHYRLAAHLSLAIIIYCMIFWSLLNYKKKIFLNYKIATILILFLIILILVQIIWGAFTSGLNAGLLYQTWPLMNEQFIANDVNIKNIISIESLSNPSYVQLLHRLLAYFIILYTFSIYFFYFRRMNITKPFKLIFSAICIQVVLGIFTLISNLNIYLASLHQIGSILLISCTIYTLFYVNKQQNLIDS
ncbi:MAG: cytochrome C oxidase assembly protein [Pelagibacteraceae bacterium]|nr:cytochrome C oxidase assembly protein [Pelagibacteraceae bacterium]